MDEIYVVIRCEFVFDHIHQVVEEETLIGRDRDCGIRLPSPLVSRKHAVLLRTKNSISIRNLKCRNGTYLNGRLVSQSETLDATSELLIRPFSLRICFGVANAIEESAKVDGSTISDRRSIDASKEPRSVIPHLTAAQTRVFDLFAQGFTEKEVAARLHVTVNTVHDHAKAIYKALSVSTRGELVAYWANHPEQRTHHGRG